MSTRRSHTFRNLAGETFVRVRVLSYAGKARNGDALWNCVCDCGTKFMTRSASLLSGATRSCGCLRAEISQALCRTINRRTIPVRVVSPNCDVHYFPSMAAAAVFLGCGKDAVRIHLNNGRPFNNHIIQNAK